MLATDEGLPVDLPRTGQHQIEVPDPVGAAIGRYPKLAAHDQEGSGRRPVPKVDRTKAS